MRSFLIALCAVPLIELGAQQSPPSGPPPTPCATAERSRAFDFWLGTWDVHPWATPGVSGPRLGTNRITTIVGGCALLEVWTSARGGTGQSYNWFDTNLGNWRQLWIDQGGNTLDYTSGEYRDGAMRFSGWTLGANGARVLQKLTFFNVHRDTVRQLFESSSDSGRTWASAFDARYVRRGPPQ
jgi:hypothetical protein